MNNLYKSYQEAKEINVALNEAKKILEKEKNMLEFHEDLRNVMADIVLGVEKHSISLEFVDLYKEEIGIKIISEKIKTSGNGISFYIPGLEAKQYYFKLNKTNLNKIEKYLQKKGSDDLSIKFC